MAKPDPFRSYYGHPILPAGYDSWEINGTEFNSAGANEPVWPDLFDSFESQEIMIITQEMLDYFVTGCPDLIVAPVDNVVMLRGRMKVEVAPQPSKLPIHAESDVVTWPTESSTVRAAKPDNNAQMTGRSTRLPIRTKTSIMKVRR